MAGRTKTVAGGTSVMQNRRAKPTDEEREADPQEALWRTLDFFPTPPFAARRGCELIKMVDPTARVVREPAAGMGHMAEPMREYFEVLASDVHAHRPEYEVRDWLDDAAWDGEPDCDWIQTNPPFSIASQFVTKGLRRARRGVALLVRLAFLEGAERYAILGQGAEYPLTLLSPFSERVPMTLGRWQTDAASATAYCWCLWMKGREPMAPIWSGPGTRDRLWYADDAERYGWKAPCPLFDSLTVDNSGIDA